MIKSLTHYSREPMLR